MTDQMLAWTLINHHFARLPRRARPRAEDSYYRVFSRWTGPLVKRAGGI